MGWVSISLRSDAKSHWQAVEPFFAHYAIHCSKLERKEGRLYAEHTLVNLYFSEFCAVSRAVSFMADHYYDLKVRTYGALCTLYGEAYVQKLLDIRTFINQWLAAEDDDKRDFLMWCQLEKLEAEGDLCTA